MPHLRILVVDDDHDCADTLATLLRLWGHEAAVAYSAREALESAGRLRPAVALLDVAMPIFDGYRLGNWLRRLPGCDGLTLVAVTGLSRPADYAASMDHGFAAHVVKGHESDELPAVLAELCGETRA